MNGPSVVHKKSDPVDLKAMNQALKDPLNLLTHGIEKVISACSELGQLGVSDRRGLDVAEGWLRDGQKNGFTEQSFTIICDDGLSALLVTQDGTILAHPYWRGWEQGAAKFIAVGFKVDMK